MYVKIELNGLSDIYENLSLGMGADEILEKIFEAELGDKAEEQIEMHFHREVPEDWELSEYIEEFLLDDMGMTMEDLDRKIDGEEGE